MSIVSSRRSYDHRLRAIVSEGVDPDLLSELEIPRSTISSWIARGPANVVTLDVEDTVALHAEVLKLRQRVRILGAVVGLLKTKARIPSLAISGARIPEAKQKSEVLISLSRALVVLPLASVLRVLGLSSARYYSWKRSQTVCALEDRDSCPQTFPTQLTQDEIMAMKQMVTSEEYRHVPMRGLSLLAQRLGTVFASVSTWAKQTKIRGWRRPRKRLYPAKPKMGVRAARVDEIWHIDVSVVRLLDGTKAYIHAVIDNFSRRILAWTVARKLDPTNTCAVLVEAGKNLPGVTPAVYVDRGIENFNGAVDELHDAGLIKRVLAQVEVSFSNSMIEAFWRSMKHQWLYLNSLDAFETLEKLIEFYVTEHNTRMPHAAFRGQTPDEVYFGSGQAIPDELAAARKRARAVRIVLNRSVHCGSCVSGKMNDSGGAAVASG